MAQTKKKSPTRKSTSSKAIGSKKGKQSSINWKIAGPLVVVAVVGAFGLWKLIDTFASTSTAQEMVLGECLSANEYISRDGHTLTMQGDGNLIFKDNNENTLWSTGTSETGSKACLRSSGDLAVVNTAGKTIWSAGSTGFSGDTLAIDAANKTLIIASYKDGGSYHNAWKSNHRSYLSDGELLRKGQSLKNNGYSLTYLQNGNVILSNPKGKTIWQTGTKGVNGNAFGIYINDGRMHVYRNSDSKVVWSSKNKKYYGKHYVVKLELRRNGNLVMVNETGNITWSSGTGS